MTYYTPPSCRMNLFPRRLVGPEPRLLAAYDCNVEGSPSRIIDKTNNGYDLVTRVGTPLVGQGGGIYCRDTSSWGTAAVPIPVGNDAPAYVVEMEHDALLGGAAWVVLNASGAGAHGIIRVGNRLYTSFDGFVTSHLVPDCSFRGPHRIGFSRSSATGNFTTTLNGRLVLSSATAGSIPAGGVIIGRDGTIRKVKMSTDPSWSVASERASYVREFARRVLWSWKPQVGESSADIATGSTASGNGCSGDDWVCPAGGAGLRLTWSRLRNQLMLVDGGQGTRLQWPLRRPMFGTWWMRALVNTVGNSPGFAVQGVPGLSPAAAGSQSYRMTFTSSPVASALVLTRENGAALRTVLGLPAALGSVVDCWMTRHPSGDWRLGFAVDGRWTYDDAVVTNDVTFLMGSSIVLVPAGGGILNACYFQGEMKPEEFDWANAPSLFPEALVAG